MTIKLIYDKQCPVKVCVYAIFFGEDFYIGCTANLKNRVNSHQSAINRTLRGDRGGSARSYIYLADYLNKNGITEGEVQVLEECEVEDMYRIEAEWLYVAYRWSDLLNGSSGHQNKFVRETDYPYCCWKVKNKQYRACLDPVYAYYHFPYKF